MEKGIFKKANELAYLSLFWGLDSVSLAGLSVFTPLSFSLY